MGNSIGQIGQSLTMDFAEIEKPWIRRDGKGLFIQSIIAEIHTIQKMPLRAPEPLHHKIRKRTATAA